MYNASGARTARWAGGKAKEGAKEAGYRMPLVGGRALKNYKNMGKAKYHEMRANSDEKMKSLRRGGAAQAQKGGLKNKIVGNLKRLGGHMGQSNLRKEKLAANWEEVAENAKEIHSERISTSRTRSGANKLNTRVRLDHQRQMGQQKKKQKQAQEKARLLGEREPNIKPSQKGQKGYDEDFKGLIGNIAKAEEKARSLEEESDLVEAAVKDEETNYRYNFQERAMAKHQEEREKVERGMSYKQQVNQAKKYLHNMQAGEDVAENQKRLMASLATNLSAGGDQGLDAFTNAIDAVEGINSSDFDLSKKQDLQKAVLSVLRGEKVKDDDFEVAIDDSDLSSIEDKEILKIGEDEGDLGEAEKKSRKQELARKRKLQDKLLGPLQDNIGEQQLDVLLRQLNAQFNSAGGDGAVNLVGAFDDSYNEYTGRNEMLLSSDDTFKNLREYHSERQNASKASSLRPVVGQKVVDGEVKMSIESEQARKQLVDLYSGITENTEIPSSAMKQLEEIASTEEENFKSWLRELQGESEQAFNALRSKSAKIKNLSSGFEASSEEG